MAYDKIVAADDASYQLPPLVRDRIEANIRDASTGEGDAVQDVADSRITVARQNGILSPNYIINGGFDIWQRGTSLTPAQNLYSYTADRWQTYVNSGATVTVSRQTFTPGSAPVSGYEGAYFLRIRSTGTQAFLNQRIEDVRTLAGQTITLSFWAKASAALSLGASIAQEFGSGGSTGVNIAWPGANLTTSWQRFTSTVSLPSISGKTIGSNSFLDIKFASTTLNQDIDIWGVQVEAGSVATPFRRNANSIQGELAACQRYYYETNTLIGSMYGAAGLIARAQVQHPVVMRANPTVTISASTIFQAGTGNPAATGAITNYSDTKHVEIDVTTSSGLTNGLAATMIGNSGKLTVSAEL